MRCLLLLHLSLLSGVFLLQLLRLLSMFFFHLLFLLVAVIFLRGLLMLLVLLLLELLVLLGLFDCQLVLLRLMPGVGGGTSGAWRRVLVRLQFAGFAWRAGRRGLVFATRFFGSHDAGLEVRGS